VREITLIGQDTTCYGEDLGLKDGLALLLENWRASKACVDSLPLRLSQQNHGTPARPSPPTTTSVPTLMSRCSTPRRTVLKRMKRGGGADVFLRSIEKMRRVIPGVTLRTSFIVGFPGETEKEFEELCGFVKDASFDWMGAFGYSDQEGAGAFDQDKKFSPREIEAAASR
jgi:ribosomal protein S12 methylthiotransferase